MGFFSNIFSKKPDLPPVDLSLLKTDVHSHLIPGIDDGAATMDDSCALIQRFVDLGYSKLITTPHVMSDYYKNTSESITKGLEELKVELQKRNINIHLDCAAEYYLDEHFMELIAKKDLLTFGDNFVLFELPFISEPRNFKEAVFELQMAGYKPMLAHVERYGFWYGDFGKYEELQDKGVYMQMNINSLSGYYSPETKKVAEKIIDLNHICLLGSDCHHMNHLDLISNCLKSPALHKLMNSGLLLNSGL